MVNLFFNLTRGRSSHKWLLVFSTAKLLFGTVWVTDTNTEASPPRSPPHEADTVALEEQLKGTRLTRKGDPSSFHPI